ncbi:ankyrin repeat domain-containing protein [Hymenobacter sp. BT507]|uniref:Ankyrin repeat domain-containing protein n=1 Tax=Hymenobacter citatus TaxID=2763506 RepID=A0ABR7MN12_9BACT|nr:ankyrin repeat domain-containing protein [Hymenobacter citatus]MBC6612472.1 ankyrin repeat domain-containing protein [Hymenobacter citatus]
MEEEPQTGRWALLAATACFFVLPWVVLRHTSVLPSIAAGNEAHLKLLLWCGADPNERPQHETPLIAAVQLGRADLVETLLRHGADPNGRSSAFMNSTPVLFYAASYRQTSNACWGCCYSSGQTLPSPMAVGNGLGCLRNGAPCCLPLLSLAQHYSLTTLL